MASVRPKIAITQYSITGFKQLEQGLNALTDANFRTNALRSAGRKAMAPVKDAMVAAAPTLKETSILPTGSIKDALKDSIRMRVSVNKSPKMTKAKKPKITKASKSELRIVIATGKEAQGYAIVSEYGRKETQINRYSAFGKLTQAYEVTLPTLVPKPWMRPTFDRMKGDILFTFRKELSKEIIKKAKAQARRKAKS